jgi:hypothetical protein
MSVSLYENTKSRITKLEQQLKETDVSNWNYNHLQTTLNAYKQKLLILQDSKTLEKAKADMKIIMQHTQAIEDKYNCRSVRFMFWLADLRIMPKGLSDKIRSYTINKINAPVCSIAGGPKPELPPMPKHMGILHFGYEERRRREREEILKYRAITMAYLDYKPTRWEAAKERLRVYINKKLS